MLPEDDAAFLGAVPDTRARERSAVSLYDVLVSSISNAAGRRFRFLGRHDGEEDVREGAAGPRCR